MAFKPRTVKIPLFSGDYQQRVDLIDAELETARKAADKASKSGTPRMLHEDEPGTAERARIADLETEREALVTKAEDNGEVTIVTIQALSKLDGVPGRKRWNALVREHPPRTEDDVPEATRKADADLGVNDDTFGEALVPLSVVGISDDDMTVDELLDAISSAQFDLIYAAAFALNRGVGSNPKSPRRSQPSPNGDATETLPDAPA